MLVSPRLTSAYHKARRDLIWERASDGPWIGELSSSALSTATAISALSLSSRADGGQGFPLDGGSDDHGVDSDNGLIDRGIAWLVDQQNPDGGWGDTDRSYSNISTTMLVEAAIHLGGRAEYHDESLAAAAAYVASVGGVSAVRGRYGKDRTFAVPILTNYALAGLCDWKEVTPLPFELACFPKRLYRMLNLHVVSYAIPALVAVGQVRHHHVPPKNPITRWLRNRSRSLSLRVVQQMQPASGGFLEAIPLTSFVVMSLASMHDALSSSGKSTSSRSQNQRLRQIVRDGLRFIRNSVRDNGSWPIDTNLATWNTSQSINALGVDGKWDCETSLEWLLECQHKESHPFTGADPGGWGWSDLSGAVPDVDDTSAALLALAHFRRLPSLSSRDLSQIRSAARQGIDWLVSLQNRDGGWPTFCRGWGRLPFDRSGTDLTAHALRATDAWAELYTPHVVQSLQKRGFSYLERTQNPDGSWTPLWFGNQDHPSEENRVYGTAKVLLAYRDLRRSDDAAAVLARDWLVDQQNHDGGWGTSGGRTRPVPSEVGNPSPEDDASAENVSEGNDADRRAEVDLELAAPVNISVHSSVEETALAIEAILTASDPRQFQATLQRGLDWLITAIEKDQHRCPAPIGLYFAKLWYHERLYPMTFSVSALRMAVKRLVGDPGIAETSQKIPRR